MAAFIITIVIGAFIIVMGIINTKGNISTLHSYHRERVKPEDVLPFGRLVGIGTIIIGIAVMTMGVLSIFAVVLEKEIFTILGTVIMLVGIVIGCIISFYAMIKYNKGIF